MVDQAVVASGTSHSKAAWKQGLSKLTGGLSAFLVAATLLAGGLTGAAGQAFAQADMSLQGFDGGTSAATVTYDGQVLEDGDYIPAGATVEFDVRLSNDGDATASGGTTPFEVDVNFPVNSAASVTFQPASGSTYTAGTDGGLWSYTANIGASAARILSLDVTPGSPGGGTESFAGASLSTGSSFGAVFSAEITSFGNAADGNASNDTFTRNLLVGDPVTTDLSVLESTFIDNATREVIQPGHVLAVGSTITSRVVLRNEGAQPTNNEGFGNNTINLDLSIPANFSFVSTPTYPGAIYNSAGQRWSISDSIGGGGTIVLEAVFSVDSAPAPRALGATLIDTGVLTSDSNAGNDFLNVTPVSFVDVSGSAFVSFPAASVNARVGELLEIDLSVETDSTTVQGVTVSFAELQHFEIEDIKGLTNNSFPGFEGTVDVDDGEWHIPYLGGAGASVTLIARATGSANDSFDVTLDFPGTNTAPGGGAASLGLLRLPPLAAQKDNQRIGGPRGTTVFDPVESYTRIEAPSSDPIAAGADQITINGADYIAKSFETVATDIAYNSSNRAISSSLPTAATAASCRSAPLPAAVK
ncbi:hypothetical protein [Limibacillus halophilus]